MDTKKIMELIDIMDKAELTALRVDDGSMKIELERSTGANTALPLMAERAVQLLSKGGATAPAHTEDAPAASMEEDSTVLVRSPMVGTFYTAPSPDEEPFIKVGQEVQAGQTLAIVEVMKMMNEIVAEKPGVVLEVLAANGTQIEYDQPLFRLTSK